AGGRALGLQRAEATGGDVTRDATHARAVRPVRRELDLDDRIIKAHDVDVTLADILRVSFAEIDNALMVLGELQLALRDEHAVGDDATHRTLVERDTRSGNKASDR